MGKRGEAMRLPLRSKLAYKVGRYLPFLKLQPAAPDRQAVMTLRPARNTLLTWETRESGETVLTVPENESVSKLTRWMARRLNVPTEHKVELDEVGGFVWQLCDGSRTIDSIVQETRSRYKMNRREAEVSVTTFLQTLHERKFIGFYKKVASKS